MADSRSRREDLDDLDEVFAEQAIDDDDELDYVDDDEVDADSTSSRGRVKTAPRPAVKKTARKSTKVVEDRGNIFSRLGRFVREIVAELRKVNWSTRSELLRYASVVLLFVAVMMTIVALADVGFAKAVLFVFGNGKK